MNVIRKTYPAPDSIYVGFKESEEKSEAELAWRFRNDDEEEDLKLKRLKKT